MIARHNCARLVGLTMTLAGLAALDVNPVAYVVVIVGVIIAITSNGKTLYLYPSHWQGECARPGRRMN